MDYLHTNHDAIIHYNARNMILKSTSVYSYLVLPRSRSQAAAHYHLAWINNPRQVNVPLNILCQTLKDVVGSTTKAET